VALGDIQDTKWQVNVVEVFEEDSQRLSRAPLIVSLLKIEAVDQESIFGFVLLHLFIYFVLQVILEHQALCLLSHSQTCIPIDMLLHVEEVDTQAVLTYRRRDLLEVFYKCCLCLFWRCQSRVALKHLENDGLELLQLSFEHLDCPIACHLDVKGLPEKVKPEKAD